MRGLGEGVAFASLVIGAAWLELNDKPAAGLWILIFIWVIFSSWGQKKTDDDA